MKKYLHEMSMSEKMDLAENTKDPEVLRALSEEFLLAVLVMVAGNEFAPIDVLKKLAQNYSWIVRHAVVNNSATPIEILEELTNDKHSNVKTAASKNLLKKKM